MTLGPVTAALAVVYTVAVFALMEFVVERRLYTRSFWYGRVLVLVIMIAMVDAFSLLGLLIAPLVATTIQIFLNEMMSNAAAAKCSASSSPNGNWHPKSRNRFADNGNGHAIDDRKH